MADKQIQLQNKAKTDNLFPKVRIQDVDNLSTTLDGVVHKSGTETITGAKTFSANTTFNGNITTSHNSLMIDCAALVDGDLRTEEDLHVVQDATVDGKITGSNLETTGSLSFYYNTTKVGEMYAETNADICMDGSGGDLTFTGFNSVNLGNANSGQVEIFNDCYVDNDLSVTGDISTRGDLTVEGNAIFDNDVRITNADLYVTDGSLNVYSNVTVGNDLKFENEFLNPDGDPYLEINSTIPSGATTATITSIKFDGTYYLPPTVDLSHYVTLDTAQTITANKTFTGSAYTFDDSELRLTNNTVLKTDTNINFYCGNDNQCYLRGLKGSIQSPGSVFADIYFDADDNSLNFDAGEYYVTANDTIFINSTNNDIHIQLGGGDSTFNFLSGDDLIFRTDGGYISMTTGGTSGSIAYFTTYSLTSGRYYDFPDTDGILLTNNNSYEEYLQWGGGNKSGEVSPVGMALSSEHSSNRIAYVDPDAISIEYSTDGTNWSSMYMTNEGKIGLCTTSADIPVGADVSWDNRQVGSKTRITFTACNGTTTFFYTNPRKMLINVATSGIMTVLVEYRTGTNYLNDGAWETFGTYSLSGWSGWNDIPLILGTLGGGTDQYGNNWQLRLTFINGQLDPNYQTTADVYAIRIFGENAWSTPSNLARIGHLYDYDTSQNAFFPNDVYANNQRLAKITEIPTVNDATITFTQNGVVKGSFSTNQGSNQTIALDGGGGGGGSGLIECSQAYLHSLESNGTLTPGQWYAITDYAPTWSGNGFTMQGHQFDILVLATSATELNRNVLFRKHAGDTYFHNCDINKWKGKLGPYLTTVSSYTINGYVLDELEDDNGNRCPYDFKNLAYINQTPYGATVSIAKYYTFSEKYNDVVVDVTTELANSGEGISYLAHNCVIDTNSTEHAYSLPSTSWIVHPRKICYLRYYWYNSDNIYFGPSCFNIAIGVRGTETFQATGGNMSFMGYCDSINIYGYYTMNLCFDGVSYSNFNHPGFTASKVTNSNRITFHDDAGVDSFTIDQCYYLDIGTTNVYMRRVFMQGCLYLNVRSSSSSYANRESITLNNITGTSSSNRKTVSITDSNSVYCTNLHSNV